MTRNPESDVRPMLRFAEVLAQSAPAPGTCCGPTIAGQAPASSHAPAKAWLALASILLAANLVMPCEVDAQEDAPRARAVEWARSYHAARDLVFSSRKPGAGGTELALQSLHAAERLLGPDHPCTAWSLDVLGVALDRDGASAVEAEAAHLRALSIRQGTQPRNAHDLSRSFDLLGSFYKGQRRYDEAAQVYQQEISLNERYFGNVHLLSSLYNFAHFAWDIGNYAMAASLIERRMRLEPALEDASSFSLGQNLWALGRAYGALGRIEQAEDVLTRAVTLFEAAQGPYGWSLASVLKDLADLLERTGQHERAHALSVRSRSIYASPVSRSALADPRPPQHSEWWSTDDPGLWQSACDFAQHPPEELDDELRARAR